MRRCYVRHMKTIKEMDKIEYSPLTSIIEIAGTPYEIQLGQSGSFLIILLYKDKKVIHRYSLLNTINKAITEITVREIIEELPKCFILLPEINGYEIIKSIKNNGLSNIEDAWKRELNKRE